LKNRHSVAPSTPQKEFINNLSACDSGSFFARLAASRCFQICVVISGRQCLVRENTVPFTPSTCCAGSVAISPSISPTGSTRKVRMMDGYRLL